MYNNCDNVERDTSATAKLWQGQQIKACVPLVMKWRGLYRNLRRASKRRESTENDRARVVFVRLPALCSWTARVVSLVLLLLLPVSNHGASRLRRVAVGWMPFWKAGHSSQYSLGGFQLVCAPRRAGLVTRTTFRVCSSAPHVRGRSLYMYLVRDLLRSASAAYFWIPAEMLTELRVGGRRRQKLEGAGEPVGGAKLWSD